MTAAGRALGRFGAARPRAVDWGHPEWWVVPVVAAAWLALAGAAVVRWISESGASGGRYPTLFVCPIVTPATGGADGSGPLLAAGLGSGLMVVAMMGPLVVPTLHHVGLSGLWSRRRRGPALVLGGFVATWLPVVWVMDVTIATIAGATGALAAVALAIAFAALWHGMPARTRAIRRCGTVSPLPPRGWRADVACVRFGSRIGRSCVVACAGYMLVATAAGHGVLAMATLAAIQLHERVSPRPRRLPGLAVLLAVGAVAVTTVAVSR